MKDRYFEMSPQSGIEGVVKKGEGKCDVRESKAILISTHSTGFRLLRGQGKDG